MREDIEQLIDYYTNKVYELEREAKEESIGISYIMGSIRAYNRVIEDLQELLDENPLRLGKWRIDKDDNRKWDRIRFYCSECGQWQTYGETKYCPKCGSIMMKESK